MRLSLSLTTRALFVITATLAWCEMTYGEAPVQANPVWVSSVSISPDGSKLARAQSPGLLYQPGQVLVRSLTGSAEDSVLPNPHGSAVWKVLFSPDGKWLASSDYRGEVRLWNLESNEIKTLNGENWVRAMAFNASGDTLVVGNQRGKVLFFNLADGATARTMDAHAAAVMDVTYIPQGQLITSGADNIAKIWPASGEGEPVTLTGHSGPVWAVAAMGDVIATASADKSIKLWDAAGKELATLAGHTDWVSDLAFADAESLISVSHDRTVRLWSVSRKGLTETLGPVESTLWGVAMSPDGKHLVAGSRSHGAIVFGHAWRQLSTIPEAPAPVTPEQTAGK